MVFVLSERDSEGGGDKRSDAHEEHLDPKRNRDEFADGLPDHHQDSRREKNAKRTRQPGSETIRRLPQRLIQPRPSQYAEINHEHGCEHHPNAGNMNGLNRGNNPTVMILYKDATVSLREPLGKLIQSSIPSIGE